MDDYIKLLQGGLIDIDADKTLLPNSIDQEVKTFMKSDPDGTRGKNYLGMAIVCPIVFLPHLWHFVPSLQGKNTEANNRHVLTYTCFLERCLVQTALTIFPVVAKKDMSDLSE